MADAQLDMLDEFEKKSAVRSSFTTALFAPKFPYAILLNAQGEPVTPNELVYTDTYQAEHHKGKIGCPCCGGPLKFTPEERAAGSVDRRAYFSTIGKLEDAHDLDCEFREADPELREQVARKYEFFGTSGPKLLYWNFKYPSFKPEYSDAVAEPSPLKREGVIATGKAEGEATYGVKTMDEFMALSRRKPFDDPFWNTVTVYVDERRIPFSKFMMGAKPRAHLAQAFALARDNGYKHAQVRLVNIPANSEHGRCEASGEFYVDCAQQLIKDSKDLMGFRHFPLVTRIYTKDNALWNSLIEEGGAFMIHGIANTNPLEVAAITAKIRGNDPFHDPNQDKLRSTMHVNSSADIIRAKTFDPQMAAVSELSNRKILDDLEAHYHGEPILDAAE